MSAHDERRQRMRERLQKQLVARAIASPASPADRLQKCEQDLSFLMEGLANFFQVTVPQDAFLFPIEGPQNENSNDNKFSDVKEGIIRWSAVLHFLATEWPRVEKHFHTREGQGALPEQNIVAGNNLVRNFMAEGREKWKRLQYMARDLPEDLVIQDPVRLNIFPTARQRGKANVRGPGRGRIAGLGK